MNSYPVPSDKFAPNTWKVYASHLGGYMKRWILRTPWFTLRLHKILKSDEGRDFHDHPFNFTSIILCGGYLEHVPGCGCVPCDDDSGRTWLKLDSPCRYYGPGSIIRRRAPDFHRLELTNGPALTFVIGSRYFRRWGFLVGDQWTDFADYHRSFYKAKP